MSADIPDAPTSAVATPTPPSRVFGEVWWRSFVLSVVGGGVIGFLAGPIALFLDGDVERSVPGAVTAAVVGALVGGAVGLPLGVVGGFVTGVVGVVWLVPYRGATVTSRTLRVAATVSVAALFPIIAHDMVFDDLTSAEFAGVYVAAVVAALLTGPRVGAWYVERMQG